MCASTCRTTRKVLDWTKRQGEIFAVHQPATEERTLSMAIIAISRAESDNHEKGESMGSTLNLSLTDELRAFVDGQSADGTMYATPSEFARDLIPKHKPQIEAERLRTGVIQGFQDATDGRVHQFKVCAHDLMKKRLGE